MTTDQAEDRDGPGRCETHGTVLVQRFEIDGAQMRPTGRYRCVKCSEGERR